MSHNLSGASHSQTILSCVCFAMTAGFYASVFLLVVVGGCGVADAVPQWKCKKYDVGNVDKKVVLFINYAGCPPENCLLNVTMLSMLAHLVRNHPANQLVLLVDEGVPIPIFKRKNRVGHHLLVKNFGNTDGLNVDKKLFGSSAVLIFDKFSSLVYKLPYSFEFQKKKNMSRLISQKNYNFIIKASLFATIYENVCSNEVVSWWTDFVIPFSTSSISATIFNRVR